jgi:hypothetical protein
MGLVNLAEGPAPQQEFARTRRLQVLADDDSYHKDYTAM